MFWFTDGISGRSGRDPCRGDAVSDELLEFLDVGKAPRSFARPDELALRANVEDASRPRDEREFANVVLERGEQLLRHPGGAEKPAALRTVFDFYPRTFGCHGSSVAGGRL